MIMLNCLFVLFILLFFKLIISIEKRNEDLWLLVLSFLLLILGCGIYDLSSNEYKLMFWDFLAGCYAFSSIAFVFRKIRNKERKHNIETTYLLIIVFSYLVFISMEYYSLYDSTFQQLMSGSNICFLISVFFSYLLKSLHFAFHVMTEGTLFDSTSQSNKIIASLGNTASNYTPFSPLTLIIIGIAPFSTATWVISVIVTGFSAYLKMFFSYLSLKKTLLFMVPNERSIYVAEKIIEGRRNGINAWNVVFCRCDKYMEGNSADIISRIDRMGGMLFQGTEADYHSPSERSYCFICAESYEELNKYASVLNQKKNRYKDKIVIHDGYIKDIEMMLNSGKSNTSIEDYKRISTWKEVFCNDGCDYDESKVVLIIGAGRLKHSLLDELCQNSSSNINNSEKYVLPKCDIIVFPASKEEHRYLMERQNQMVTVRDPEEYVNNSMEDDIYHFIRRYYPLKEKIVYIVAEDVYDNLRIKHLLYEWLKDELKEDISTDDDSTKFLNKLNVEFKIYCNNQALQNIEEAWDNKQTKRIFKYLGEEQEIIEIICDKIHSYL